MTDKGITEDFNSKEKEIESKRDLVLKVVKEINKPENYDGFKKAATEMFAAFGVIETDDTELKAFIERDFRRNYDRKQETPEMDLDIVMYGTGKEEYANINIRRKNIPGTNLKVDVVSPGGCSVPMNASGFNKESSFYESFEKQIGVDPQTYTMEEPKRWVDGRRNENDIYHIFAVVGSKYFRIPANEWTAKLVSKRF